MLVACVLVRLKHAMQLHEVCTVFLACTGVCVTRSLSLQTVSLDFLNLRLADYEVNTDAFVAFRSRQLQAPRLLILDPTHSQGTGEESGVGDNNREEGYLEELIMVSTLCD